MDARRSCWRRLGRGDLCGIYPGPVLDLMNSSLNYLSDILQNSAGAVMVGMK